ncbi:DUF1771 [Geosmithia morbida]|uniref:DUF1771 n=1 Tax=Geosmithia morbida TaxID=1094350 RepID=A0A9P4YXI2_9HYPO|nr:DUF1771 [Geosmithia morbida]KAF4123551.1 DUF1771 [Geosmithia morbida]
MVSDEHYDLCLPVLQDATLEDEDKTDRLEEVLKKQTSLTGTSLDNAVLDALWRYRDGASVSASPPPIRHSILRRASPASFRASPTPISGSPRLGVSPLAPPGFVPSNFGRAKTASPFSSPRASPRPGYVTPAAMPHSPNLSAYEFASDTTPATEIQGEYQTENVEWLVNDDAVSLSSSVGTSSGLNAAAPEFSSVSSQHADMSPYDMLRSILGQVRTDEEIETALAAHSYDLSATIASFMDSFPDDVSLTVSTPPNEPRNVLVGKSVSPDVRPITPVSSQKSGIICKFYMSTGQCLRADCRFSHDLSNHLCKYWMMGSCLAGDTCVFSHDPAKLLNKLSLDGAQTPPSRPSRGHGNLPLHDANSFPSLSDTGDHLAGFAGSTSMMGQGMLTPPGLRPMRHGTESPRSRSRPGSRHQARDQQLQQAQASSSSSASASAPALDDTEAFPSLGSASASKQAKKHHGKRGGHGYSSRENATPNSSLADIVKMSPSPGSVSLTPDAAKKSGRNGAVAAVKNGEDSAAAQAIPSPKNIPWLETGERANKAYLKARQEAIKHGGLRNKFLQSTVLPKRGTNGKETRPIYAITGSGHHSKNGKDKVGKAIRNFLNQWRYAYREFSVPGDRNNMGGILGIDPRSWDKSLEKGDAVNGADEEEEEEADQSSGGVAVNGTKPVDILDQAVEIGDGKVRLLVRDPPKGPSAGRR